MFRSSAGHPLPQDPNRPSGTGNKSNAVAVKFATEKDPSRKLVPFLKEGSFTAGRNADKSHTKPLETTWKQCKRSLITRANWSGRPSSSGTLFRKSNSATVVGNSRVRKTDDVRTPQRIRSSTGVCAVRKCHKRSRQLRPPGAQLRRTYQKCLQQCSTICFLFFFRGVWHRVLLLVCTHTASVIPNRQRGPVLPRHLRT